VNSFVPRALAVINDIQARFQRDDEVDMEAMDSTVKAMKKPQLYSEEEDGIFEQVKEVFSDHPRLRERREASAAGIISTLGRVVSMIPKLLRRASSNLQLENVDSLKQLDSPDHLVTMSVRKKRDSTEQIFGVAELVVDAPIEAVCAWIFRVDGRSKSMKKQGLKIKVTNRENEHSQTAGIKVGEDIAFRSRMNWKVGSEGGKKRIAIVGSPVSADVTAQNDNKIRSTSFLVRNSTMKRISGLGGQRSKSLSLWSLAQCEELESKGSVAQTKVVFHIMIEPNDWKMEEWKKLEFVRTHLLSMCGLRGFFDQSRIIDAEDRQLFMQKIDAEEVAEYSPDEIALLDIGLSSITAFENSTTKVTKKAMSPLAKNEISHASNGKRYATGRSKTTVRANVKEVLAFHAAFVSRFEFNPGTSNMEILEEKNGHNQLAYLEKVVPGPLHNRDLLVTLIWKKLGADTYLHVTEPTLDDRRPAIAGSLVRSHFSAIMRLKSVGEDKTDIEHLFQLDTSKGHNSLNNLLDILGRATLIQEYFQQLRKLEDLDDDDGKAMGESLYLARSKKGEGSVSAVIERHASLRELAKKLEWLVPFLEAVVAIDLGLGLNLAMGEKKRFDETSGLDLVEMRHAKLLADVLRANLTNYGNEALAVEAFFEGIAMKEFAGNYPFFKSLINAIVHRHVTEMTKWKWAECIRKALLNASDIGSDAATGVVYWVSGDRKTALMLL
jgi:hypothetical protein